MRLHCSINVCFKLLTTGWKFGYRRSKFRPRPRIPGQLSIPHVGFCPAYVRAFPGLGESGRREGGGGDLLSLVYNEVASIRARFASIPARTHKYSSANVCICDKIASILRRIRRIRNEPASIQVQTPSICHK